MSAHKCLIGGESGESGDSDNAIRVVQWDSALILCTTDEFQKVNNYVHF